MSYRCNECKRTFTGIPGKEDSSFRFVKHGSLGQVKTTTCLCPPCWEARLAFEKASTRARFALLKAELLTTGAWESLPIETRTQLNNEIEG